MLEELTERFDLNIARCSAGYVKNMSAQKKNYQKKTLASQ